MHLNDQTIQSLAQIMSFGQLAAGIAILTAASTAFGQGRIASHAIDAIARQPESRGAVSSTMIIGIALAETGGIYAFVLSLLLLFANPIVNRFIELIVTGS
jgi:F-type H+-transporting ATPase subunit c